MCFRTCLVKVSAKARISASIVQGTVTGPGSYNDWRTIQPINLIPGIHNNEYGGTFRVTIIAKARQKRGRTKFSSNPVTIP